MDNERMAAAVTDLEWLKRWREEQCETMRQQGEMLIEIRDLAIKTNGRVNAHDMEIAALNKSHESLAKSYDESRMTLANLVGGATVVGVVASLLTQFIPALFHK